MWSSRSSVLTAWCLQMLPGRWTGKWATFGLWPQRACGNLLVGINSSLSQPILTALSLLVPFYSLSSCLCGMCSTNASASSNQLKSPFFLFHKRDLNVSWSADLWDRCRLGHSQLGITSGLKPYYCHVLSQASPFMLPNVFFIHDAWFLFRLVGSCIRSNWNKWRSAGFRLGLGNI